MKLMIASSLLMLLIAVFVGSRLYRRPTRRWHEGEHWQALLDMYDEIAREQYHDCHSRLVATKFGDTQVFACGSPENPAIVLFHGISASSLMFGSWLVPKLSQSHFTIALDTLCDMGRSRPTDGDPSNCRQTEEEFADWVRELLTHQLKIPKASLIGFSFGSFLASCITRHASEIVNKVVLIAPAVVFAPIQLSWVFRAITFGMFINIVGWDGSYGNMLRNWFFGYMSKDPESRFQYPRMLEVSSIVGGAQIAVRFTVYSDHALTALNERHPTMLIIGQDETVIDAAIAIESAGAALIQTKAYPNAGHMLFSEWPRNDVVDTAMTFLNSPTDREP